MTRGRRGLALLLVVCALGVMDALLAMLWLHSRAEAREAAESRAVSRAEWAAAASLTEAVGWLAGRETPTSDTTLQFAPTSPGILRAAAVRRHGAELVEVRAEGRAEVGGSAVARSTRCAWLGPASPDSTGLRRLAPLPGTQSRGC